MKELKYDPDYNDFDWVENGIRSPAISIEAPIGVYATGEIYFTGIDSHYIAKCVNNHERLVEALQNVCDMWKTVCNVSGWDEQHMAQYEKARTLLASLEAEKGGEL